MQGFVLAAGFGTRLRPYSLKRPKPLFPILGKPILKVIFEQLQSLSIKHIGINTFFLKDQVKHFVRSFKKHNPSLSITLFEESELLGTGGGLWNARKFLGNDTTLIVNSDILTNLCFKEFVHFHKTSKNLITMLFVKGKNNNVLLSEDLTYVRAFRVRHPEAFTYGGIQIIEPDALKYFFEEKDLIKIYTYFLEKGIKIGAFVPKKIYLKDIGTIESYLEVHKDLLTTDLRIPFCPKFSKKIVAKSPTLLSFAKVKGWIYAEKNLKVFRRCFLKNCVVWDGARLIQRRYENCIVT